MRPLSHALAILALLSVVCAAARAEDNWPEYRGPTADGHSRATGLPLTWSETQNVKWKTAIHGRAWSSPVVWGEQIWLTTATEDGHQMFAVCISRQDGRTLLDKRLFDNAETDPIADINSYGSPSPVIEEGRVYVHFGTYGTACLDTRTLATVWTRRDIHCSHSVGPGSSPVLFENLLILTMDGTDVQYTLALDKQTGKTVWKADRAAELENVRDEMRKSFNTPRIVAVNGQPQLLSPGAMAFYAYDPRTGRELWRIRHNGYSNASRTLVGHGLAFISTGYNHADLLAVRLGGAGDVTDSHVVWKYSRNAPYKPSAALVGDLLFVADDSGVMTCLEARTGAEVWKERLGGHYSASPVYAEGRLYLFSEEGQTTVLKPGRRFEKIAESRLPDGFMASPAIVGEALFLRTKTHLYRMEKK